MRRRKQKANWQRVQDCDEGSLQNPSDHHLGIYNYIIDVHLSLLSPNQHEQEVGACRCVHIPAVSAHCGQAQTRRW